MFFPSPEIVDLLESEERNPENNPDCESSSMATPVTCDKYGRNDPCPCGSVKKYKNCCGA